MNKTISSGIAHKMPIDLEKALISSKAVIELWEGLTPLARNEWICWVTFPKKMETRIEHVKRTVTELKEGKRRPCCWLGCTHRKDKTVSPSVQRILSKRAKRV